MPAYIRAIGWALAIVMVAMLNRHGLISDSMAQTLIIVLPALAVVSMVGRKRCNRRTAV